MATKVVLLERVESLGEMGEVVSVRPGYARNYLLPQKKALRASDQNIAYFEAQKKALQADSDKRKKEAEKLAKKIEGLKVPLIRQASEAGQLFGSVTARDIAAQAAEAAGESIDRQMVLLNQNFKSIGLFPVDIALHPEVKVQIVINIARSAEEAEVQAKTGKALIADAQEEAEETQEAGADLSGVLEDSALEIEKQKAADAAEEAEEEAEAAAKSAARKEKKAKKAADAEPEEGEAEEQEEPAEDKSE